MDNIKKGKKTLEWDWWTKTATILVCLGVVAIFFPWNILDGYTIKGFTIGIKGYNDFGTFVYGISTPLFGLATILMLVRTYTMQKQQLQDANSGFELQMGVIRRQRFEDSFFRLLENHQRIVEAMDLHDKKGKKAKEVISVKRDCFRTFYNHMDTDIEIWKKKCKKDKVQFVIKDINDIYNETQNYYKADLHHYFRFIYHILKFVKNSEEITPVEKYKYTSILRATLSPYELILIFYNCLHEFGNSHFKPLVEEFSFLKNIHDDLIFEENQKKEYHSLAFAPSEKRLVLMKSWKRLVILRRRKLNVPEIYIIPEKLDSFVLIPNN